MSLFLSGESHADSDKIPRFTSARLAYLEGCGGCHGIQGVSAVQDVPVLRGQAGRFLCTQRGREYLIRLPNVALTSLSDSALAELMNFVAFDLGDGRALSPEAQPFTQQEIQLLRQRPLNSVSLRQYRADLLNDLADACGSRAARKASLDQ